MTSIVQIKNINEFITSFMTEHGSEDMVEQWNKEENMEEFTKLVLKASKEKRNKDPSKPKRGKSAYIFFCEVYRDAAKAELGDDAKATDVTTKLGEMWGMLKQSDKKDDKKMLASFEKKAKEDKERYDQEMIGYEPPKEILKASRKNRSFKKNPDAPKRAKSAYIFFCADNRDRVKEDLGEDAKAIDVTTRLGELWNELKLDKSRENEIKVYNNQAVKDKARYESEMVDCKHLETDDADADNSSEKKKAVSKKVTVESDKPTGKKNGYTCFCQEHREKVKLSNPEMKAVDVTKQLAQMWKVLDKAEQQEWNDAAKERE